MATTQVTTSNYTGKAAGSIIGAAFKQEDTLRLNLVTLMENVGHKANLRKVQYSNGTIGYTCGFTPQGAITMSEKVVEPLKFMNPLQICKEEFRQTWSEDSMGASASNPNAPADIMEAIQLEAVSSQAEKVEDDIWQGDSANIGEFDGFIKLWGADAAIIKDGNGVTAPGHVCSESTVIADLKLALAAIPQALRRKSLVVGVSPNVYQFYWFYQITQGLANDGSGEDKTTRFGRHTLVEVGGFPDDVVAVWEPKNLVFATGLASDHNEVQFVDEDEIGLLSGQVRGKITYSAAVGYYNSNEIVYLDLTA
jgi:hypothetical protein